MLFNSQVFAYFFVAVFATSWALVRWPRARTLLLLAVSYLFYGWWETRFLFLIVLSTAIDYCCGLLIDRGRIGARRRALVSAFVLGGAAVFVLPYWERIGAWSRVAQAGALLLQGRPLAALAEGVPRDVLTGRLLPLSSSGPWVLAWTAGGVLVANALYEVLVRLPATRRRKLALLASVVANLGLLGIFKYYNFFTAELADGLARLGVQLDLVTRDIVLPVGISFYTFQTLSYTIDVYRGRLPHEPSFSRFALFVAFFPQLVAGPIVRASHFLPQLRARPTLDLQRFEGALALIFWGLAKKVVIADYLGTALVDPFWSQPGAYGGWASVVAVYGYAFQIYGDFSGYSDVAIGTARLLGYELGENFRSPYRATGPREFWTRWHISLSSWLRDYLYIPLGGNRGGAGATYRNLLLTMLLGGLWHGASWMFVLWGLLHGLLLVGDRLLGLPPPATAAGAWLRRLVFFQLVCVTWICFRSPDVASAGAVLQSFVSARGDAAIGGYVWLALALAVASHLPADEWKARLRASWLRVPAFAQGAAYALLTGLLLNSDALERPFIYFQF